MSSDEDGRQAGVKTPRDPDGTQESALPANPGEPTSPGASPSLLGRRPEIYHESITLRPALHARRREPPVAERSPAQRAPAPPKEVLSTEDATTAAGSVIQHYEIIRPLGSGGMGHVLLARDTRLGRLVAIKLLARRPGMLAQRFLAEARVTAQLSHENIVIIHELGDHDGTPYMVIEYLRGKTLAEYLDERHPRYRDEGARSPEGAGPGLPPGRVAEIMIPVVRALMYAHERGIVHRDLKPSNIMLTDTGTIKVLDFGIAKLLDAQAAIGEPFPPELLAAGDDPMSFAQTSGLVGTMPYMSPEQWGAGSVDERADIWAAGILLAELTLGQHPLSPYSMPMLFTIRALDVPMPSMLEMRPELGKLASIIDRCLIKRKEDRLGSARELLAELESLAPAPRRVPTEEEDNPYNGLAAFQEGDSARFFGRTQAITEVVTRLSEQPLIAIVGVSGAGKSSFVRAGIIPALARTGDAWEAVMIRPGAYPMAALAELLLARALRTPTRPPPRSSESALAKPHDRDTLIAKLGDEPGFLGTLLRARARRKLQRIVLFVDQFEELYTLAPEEQRAPFFACLASVADDVGSPLRVVITIRSDFLDRVAEAHAAMIRLSRGLVLLAPMTRAGLREALVRPLEPLEYRFEPAGLVEEMLDTLEPTSGALPLLQFTAAKLWELRDRSRRRLTEASYRSIGGIAGTLAAHADAVLGILSAEERRLVRALMLRLVTPERTRALCTLGELRGLSAAKEVVERVIGCLIDARLLTVEGGGEAGATVEIVHESLIDRWPLLSRWLDDEQEDAQFLARLRSAARDWEASGRADGLLWRGEAAQDARRWRERHRADGDATLGKREEQYLQGVIALSARARRLRRRLIGGAFAMLAAAMALTSYLAWQQSVAKQVAEQATLKARDAARLSAARLQNDDPTTQLALLRELEGSEPPPGWAPEARHVLHAGVARVVLEGHTAGVYGVAWSPDGSRIASASYDTTVRVWSAEGSGEPIVLRGHTDNVFGLAFSPDGRRIASASYDTTVRVWSADGRGQPKVLRGHTDKVYAVAWSPDGRRIASASADRTVRVWNADGSGEPIVFHGYADHVYAVAWSPDGRRVASASDDRTVRVRNADGSGEPALFSRHTEAVYAVAWSPDGRRIASASADRTVRVWNADGSGEPIVFHGYADHVRGVAWSPDGRRIASASYDRTARVWNADGRGDPIVLEGHSNGLFGVAWSPDGRRIATASDDRTVRVWTIDDPDKPVVLGRHTHMWSVAFTPDGRRIASGSDDNIVRVWNADGSGEPIVLKGHAGAVYRVAFSPDGRRIASASGDRTLRVWNADGSGEPIVLEGHSSDVNNVAFSPDGRRIASTSGDRTLRVWNADGSGEPIVLAGQIEREGGVAWSPDGRRIASGSDDKTVRVWNVDGSGKPIVLEGHSSAVNDVAFSPDGRRIASASGDRTVRVWNADGSGKPIVLVGHIEIVNGVAFSPDGRRVASVSNDKTVRVWNADGSGEPIVFTGHTGTVDGVAFSPDGDRIASASNDKTVRIWRDLEPIKPDDPRLWSSTSYCLSVARRKDFLAASEEVASSLHERCLRRVAQLRPR
jgi:WD40 repeat protein/serine/threonine protein kinase